MRFVKTRNEKSLGDLKLEDFEEGMYLMDDNTLMDIVFTDNCEDLLADPYDDPDRFEEDVRTAAKMFGVKKKDLTDGDDWTNVGTLYYDHYSLNGELLDEGGDYLCCYLETFEHYSKRNLNGVLPVKRIPEDEAERIRV